MPSSARYRLAIIIRALRPLLAIARAVAGHVGSVQLCTLSDERSLGQAANMLSFCRIAELPTQAANER